VAGYVNADEKRDFLTPILVSGGGRSGSTQIMWLLGTDPRVKFDREFPFENRYLTYCVKFAWALQNPDLLQFFNPQQLYELNYLGFGGYSPGADYVRASSPYVYLPREPRESWIRCLWSKFCAPILRQGPDSCFYSEKAPLWLAPALRRCLPCFTVYNVRDPRDLFLSTNAFMKKKHELGFARSSSDTDYDHARRLAQAFLNLFDNYYVDRDRSDTVLVRYEDYVLDRLGVAEKLRQVVGINSSPDAEEPYVGSHATTPDPRQSVNRWTREHIPPDVLSFLEGVLHEEMAALGYKASSSVPASPVRTISFAEGGVTLKQIDHSSHGVLEPAANWAVARVGGPDFHIFVPVEPFEAAEVKEVWVSVSGEIGDFFSLYWRRRNARFSEHACMNIPYTPSPHWSILTVPVHLHPEWKGTIKSLRLDLFNSHGRPHKGTGYLRWVRLVG
jgi:hypothetical protein